MLEYRLECADLCKIFISDGKSKRLLYLDTIKSLAKDDLAAVQSLIKIHSKTTAHLQSLETTTFNTVSLTYQQAFDVLKLLLPTGRVFWKQKALSFQQLPVSKIFWKAAEGEDVFSPFLEYNFQEIALEKLDHINPCFAIYEGKLFPFASSVALKFVELFLKGPAFLAGSVKKKFLEENPKIIWKKKEVEKIAIDPELVLTDLTGCFANVRFSYQNHGKVFFHDFDPVVGKIKRLSDEEKSFVNDLIEAGFVSKNVGNSSFFCTSDKVLQTLTFLLELGWKVFAPNEKQVLLPTENNYFLKESQDGLLFEGNVKFADLSVAVRDLANQKGVFTKISENFLGLFDRKSIPLELGSLSKTGILISKTKLFQLPQFIAKSRVSFDSKISHLLEGVKEGAKFSSVAIPKEFNGFLLPYQQKGVDFLSFLYAYGFSGLLADDMGLGKTIQVLAFFSLPGIKFPILIVCPSSLVYQWQSEIKRFLSSFSVKVFDVKLQDKVFDAQVNITSYAFLRQNEEVFVNQEFPIVVLDESSYIKTQKTQTTKVARSLKSHFRIALNGTPIENRLQELVSQFAFLMPDLPFDDLQDFSKAIRPFVLRRKKEDVLKDLPEKIEQTVYLTMSQEQKALYDQTLQEAKNGVLKDVLSQGMQANRMQVLQTILRLRQVCIDPRLVGSPVLGEKIDLLMQEIQNRNVLIFSQFTSMLDLVESRLTQENIPFLRIDGTVDSEKRQALVQQYQANGDIPVFLLSLKAAGVGLNLTKADVVFILDPWWNDAVEDQAISRAHRLGQENKVLAKRYIMIDTIEEKILRLKEKKKSLQENFFDIESSDFSIEDLLSLF